jgi:hypothetical protein
VQERVLKCCRFAGVAGMFGRVRFRHSGV